MSITPIALYGRAGSGYSLVLGLGAKINSSFDDHDSLISADGLELYFSSWRPGGYGGADIYVARRMSASDPWGEPTNLGPVVNSPYKELVCSLSPDGLLLLFVDGPAPSRPGGYGDSDIWATRRASLSAPWQAPVNLGPTVNGPLFDTGACMSRDGHMLYFCTMTTTTWDNWRAPIIPIVDFNADKKVDLVDLVMLIDNWGSNTTLCDIGPMPWGDGKVDIEDLKVFMTEWEKENPPAKP